MQLSFTWVMPPPVFPSAPDPVQSGAAAETDKRRNAEEETALIRALGVDPINPDYLYALAVFYIETNRLDDALKVAVKLRENHTNLASDSDLVDYIAGRIAYIDLTITPMKLKKGFMFVLQLLWKSNHGAASGRTR